MAMQSIQAKVVSVLNGVHIGDSVGKLGRLGAKLVRASDVKVILSLCQQSNDVLDVIIDELETASEQLAKQKEECDEQNERTHQAKLQTQARLREVRSQIGRYRMQQQEKERHCQQLQQNVSSLQREIADITRRKQQKEREAKTAGKVVTGFLGPSAWLADAVTGGGVSNALAGVINSLRQEIEGKTQRADAQRRELQYMEGQIKDTVNALQQSQNMVNQYENVQRQLDARQRALEAQIKAFGRFIVGIGNIRKSMLESKKHCKKVLRDVEDIADMADCDEPEEAKELALEFNANVNKARKMLQPYVQMNYKNVPNCSGRHGLVRFAVQRRGFTCDGCKAGAPVGSIMYGCRKRNYDLCVKCYGTSVVYCTKGHALRKMATGYEYGYICNGCRARSKSSLSWHCPSCQYDLCDYCHNKMRR